MWTEKCSFWFTSAHSGVSYDTFCDSQLTTYTDIEPRIFAAQTKIINTLFDSALGGSVVQWLGHHICDFPLRIQITVMILGYF